MTETPHKCPVCGGRGWVPPGFYAPSGSITNTSSETCRSCDGKGVIWRSESVVADGTRGMERGR